MRLGVLDVGSNTVHLLIVDAHHGAAPRSAHSYKTELRLAELLEPDGTIGDAGAGALAEFVGEASAVATEMGSEELLAFATSAIRDATNGDEVLAMVLDRTGVDLQVLSGADEARLTFLAVRRWFGWSSGRLLVFDIGGGSLEVATGVTEDPDGAFSLPLGAGRLTREFFDADPPEQADVKRLRKHVRAMLDERAADVAQFDDVSHVVGTSKTFKQLARLTGAESSSGGPYAPRFLRHSSLVDWLPRLAKSSAAERATLQGISPGRAHQVLAGAVVADAVMDVFAVKSLEICPWALREGVILRRLDWMGL
ncbi:MAG TPA: Ppx/GppA phosphatase family protein [Actinomycetes bacterium]|nr:Ppx/GppA phosphatase family protein [Actinomycetes bacterium]